MPHFDPSLSYWMSIFEDELDYQLKNLKELLPSEPKRSKKEQVLEFLGQTPEAMERLSTLFGESGVRSYLDEMGRMVQEEKFKEDQNAANKTTTQGKISITPA